MTQTKREILTSLNFGERVAEDEADVLSSYFVETDQWTKFFSGKVDVVYGPKGSGKSALYSLLRQKQDELWERGIIPARGENIRGTPVFEDLVADPPASEEQFRNLWKLYFLSLAGALLRRLEDPNDETKHLLRSLEEAGLLLQTDKLQLRKILRAVLDYVRRVDLSGDVKLDPATGAPSGVGGRITFREPGAEERKQGFISADSLLELADSALAQDKISIWVVLDRLDVAFVDSPELEANALRALFRVYRDMQELDQLKVKILLRDDIWKRVTDAGFREASHITKAITITWSDHALLNLVIRRALHNTALRDYYQVDRNQVLSSVDEQQKLFYRIFPDQVDAGARKSTTFDWIKSRTADGSKETAPRELIHLLSAARDEQLKLLETGGAEPVGENLFSPTALKAALPIVSTVRFDQTLCAEHPSLKPLMGDLEGEKTQQTPASLAKVWKCNQTQAVVHAEKLCEIGFFERRGSKEEPQYWVPFLYRDALHLVQGTAE